MSKFTKRTTLNGWQMIALESALRASIQRSELDETDGTALLRLIEDADKIVLTKYTI